MTIGIDASMAVKPNRTGAENYAWEIIRRLVVIDKINNYRLYAPFLPKEDFPVSDKIDWRILPPRRLWSQVGLAKEIHRHPPDLLFIPSHVVPLFSYVPSVATLHDIAYKFFPDSYTRFARQYLTFATGVTVGKAKRIIVPSHSTKNDLAKEYPQLNPEKVAVIYHGYNAEVFRLDGSHDQPPVDPPYIFYVGRIEEKKNIRFLIEAFSLFAKEKKNVKLVLSGSRGHGYEEVQEKIRSLPEYIRSRIIQPGYLPLYDMVRYSRHASLFAFPSWYEGFGLPVLEAMAVGTPVVCSNVSSLPEVGGEAAVMLPPTNPLSWAAAFSRIINQPDYAEGLRQKGLVQVKKFSWDKAAEETLQVLLDAVKA